MILIDTSSWVHQQRSKGDPAVQKRVEALLLNGQAAWCPVTKVELWAGVRNEKERNILRQYEQTIPELPINDEIWQMACDLADLGRARGKTFPSNDLMIAACALFHEVEMEHADKHFDEILKLKKP